MARVGRDLKDHESPTHPPQAGPPSSPFNTRLGCPGPHPTLNASRDGAPQLLWAAVPAPHHPLIKNFSPDI